MARIEEVDLETMSSDSSDEEMVLLPYNPERLVSNLFPNCIILEIYS